MSFYTNNHNKVIKKVFKNLGLPALLCALFLTPLHAAENEATKTTSAEENSRLNSAWVELNGPHWSRFNQFKNAGFALTDNKQNLLQNRNLNQAFVPASTTKLITALLAIQHWGLEHRFYTDFYIRPSNTGKQILVIKGYGDPFLVSEELQLIAKALKPLLAQQGIKQLEGVELDVSYYQQALIMPGTSKSLNPYDAIPSALAANFNTIYALKKNSQILTAEPQTPMVPSGQTIVKASAAYKKSKNAKKIRTNLGTNHKLNQRYFAELILRFLEQEGVVVTKLSNADSSQPKSYQVAWSSVKNSDIKFYRHHNSRTLAEVIKPMMKYSTNFIANQIALNLGAELLGAPASKTKVAKVYQSLLQQQFDWQDFYIEDGAGLSRHNHLTPKQLLDVLQAFKPWVNLLPEVEKGVFAKSGSLIGVSTLAGYIEQNRQLLPFAMMINERVPYRFRNKLAKELASAYVNN